MSSDNSLSGIAYPSGSSHPLVNVQTTGVTSTAYNQYVQAQQNDLARQQMSAINTAWTVPSHQGFGAPVYAPRERLGLGVFGIRKAVNGFVLSFVQQDGQVPEEYVCATAQEIGEQVTAILVAMKMEGK